MVCWDRQFKIKMAENGLRLGMYKRYVDRDDVNAIVNAPRQGLKFVESEGRVVQDQIIAEQEHVNHMMLRLPYSGYDQKFRTDVVRSALKAYNRMIDASGEQPLYRLREWRRLERAQER